MKTIIYLVKLNSDWYQLRFTPDHSVLGCGTELQPLLDTVRRYVLTYKNKRNLERAVHSMYYSFKPKDTLLENREREYRERDETLNQ